MMNNKSSNSNLKLIPIYLAFLCMGFGDVVGPLVSLVKESFSISNFQAQFITFSGFIMFGLLSIPLGVLQDRKGKRFIMNLGLIIALVGLVIPILNGMYGLSVNLSDGESGKFTILIFSILLLGAGATTLQVVGNPIMRDVSPQGKYSSNLSFAQSVKAIGSSMGFLIPPFAVQFFHLDWTLLFPMYSILILINIILFNTIKYTEEKNSEKPATFLSCFKLLGDNYVLMMVIGIFLYVGAEVSMSSGVPILMKEKFEILDFGLWISWALFFLPILIGRFMGGVILRKLAPKKFLLISIVLSILGLLFMFTGSIVFTFFGIVLIGLGFANIFPLIFSITVDKMPDRANELSGLMVTAIVGGAFIPLIMGIIADMFSVLAGFIVPLLAIIYILVVALKNRKV